MAMAQITNYFRCFFLVRPRRCGARSRTGTRVGWPVTMEVVRGIFWISVVMQLKTNSGYTLFVQSHPKRLRAGGE